MGTWVKAHQAVSLTEGARVKLDFVRVIIEIPECILDLFVLRYASECLVARHVEEVPEII